MMNLVNIYNMAKSADQLSFADIDKEAEEVLRRFGVRNEPVDPIDLARRLGFIVRSAAFADPNLSGQITKKADNAVIIDFSGFDQKARQRFTVSHEIGHALLHLKDSPGSFVDSTISLNRMTDSGRGQDRKEMAANRFGAALLMPKPWVEIAVSEGLNLSALSRRFGVSQSAMSNRLKSLELVLLN